MATKNKFLLLLTILIAFANIAFSQSNDKNIDTLKNKEKYHTNGFEPGYIILNNGTKKEGLIKFNDHLIFKTNEKASREKIAPQNVNYFIVHADTFEVAKNLTYRAQGLWGDAFYKDIAFVKRAVTGDVNLYEFRTVVANGGIGANFSSYEGANLYLKRKTETNFTLISENKKKFKLTLLDYFKDNPEICKSIEDKKLTYDDMEKIVNIYNQKTIK